MVTFKWLPAMAPPHTKRNKNSDVRIMQASFLSTFFVTICWSNKDNQMQSSWKAAEWNAEQQTNTVDVLRVVNDVVDTVVIERRVTLVLDVNRMTVVHLHCVRLARTVTRVWTIEIKMSISRKRLHLESPRDHLLRLGHVSVFWSWIKRLVLIFSRMRRNC